MVELASLNMVVDRLVRACWNQRYGVGGWFGSLMMMMMMMLLVGERKFYGHVTAKDYTN